MAVKTNIEINGNKYFKVSATVGETPDHKPIRKVFYGKSKKEAEAKRDEYTAQIKKGLAVDFDKLALGACMHEWLFEVVKQSVKPSSFERYEGIYRVHIATGELCMMKLAEIKSIHIQKYYNALLDAKTTTPTIEGVHKVLNKFFRYCIQEDLIIKNPCANVSTPKNTLVETDAEKIKVFNASEIALICEAVKAQPKYFIFVFALMTGLRQGEILALKHSNVDVENRIITINKSIKIVRAIDKDGTRAGQTIVQTPKSKASIRTVPFPQSLMPYLQAYLLHEKKKHLATGVPFCDSNYFFTDEACQVRDASNLRPIWKRFLARLGVPFLKFHALRHTYCTNLGANGVSLKTASVLMGHDIAMTAKVYTHIDEAEKKRAADAINHIL